MVGKIKEKKSSENVKEVVDTKKDKFSSKVLRGFIIGVMLLILSYAVKQIYNCGLSNCYLGGAGAGSLIVTIIWLILDSIKT